MRLRTMRKSKRAISSPERIEELLSTAPVGRLGSIGVDGKPHVKPLNFVYDTCRIYFHCGLSGEKLDDIAHDPHVCFEVDEPLRYVTARTQPCEAGFRYRSAICYGTACIVHDEDERRVALALLMAKYQPGFPAQTFPDDKLALTVVVRIDIDELSGREDVRDGA